VNAAALGGSPDVSAAVMRQPLAPRLCRRSLDLICTRVTEKDDAGAEGACLNESQGYPILQRR
jgi:hypothetical protein